MFFISDHGVTTSDVFERLTCFSSVRKQLRWAEVLKLNCFFLRILNPLKRLVERHYGKNRNISLTRELVLISRRKISLKFPLLCSSAMLMLRRANQPFTITYSYWDSWRSPQTSRMTLKRMNAKKMKQNSLDIYMIKRPVIS